MFLVFLLLLPGCGKAEEEKFSFPPPDYESGDVYGGYYEHDLIRVVLVAADPAIVEAAGLKTEQRCLPEMWESGTDCNHLSEIFTFNSAVFSTLPEDLQALIHKIDRERQDPHIPREKPLYFQFAAYPLSYLQELQARLEEEWVPAVHDPDSIWYHVRDIVVQGGTHNVEIVFDWESGDVEKLAECFRAEVWDADVLAFGCTKRSIINGIDF